MIYLHDNNNNNNNNNNSNNNDNKLLRMQRIGKPKGFCLVAKITKDGSKT